jgi:hypothetical protein
MTCETVREQFCVLLNDELAPEQRAVIEDHLDECDGCRMEFEKLHAIHSLLEAREMQPPPGLLAQCRANLRAEIARIEGLPETGAETAPVGAGAGNRGRGAAQRPSWRETLAAWFSNSSMSWQVAGALALLTVGFFSGRLITGGGSAIPGSGGGAVLPATPASLSASPAYSQIRSIEPDSQGRLRIRVEEVREHVIAGNMQDEAVRRLLLETVRASADPGLRVESLEALAQTQGVKPDSEDVKLTLLAAVKGDPNAGVRLKALEGLEDYSRDTEVRRVLKEVLLRDDNPGVRIRAVDLLVEHKEDRMVPVLQELLRKEDNSYVRLRCQTALRDLKASTEIY